MSSAARHSLGLILALVLLGCGGGGGGGGGGLDLGVLASTVPTLVPVAFENPLSEPATVTQIDATGAFSIDPADLPGAAPASAEIILGLVFTPYGSGTASGSVTLRFAGVGTSQDVTRAFQATGESVLWSVNPGKLQFGLVDQGNSVVAPVTLTNQSTLSPVTLTGIDLPSAAFSVEGSPFPLTIQPSTGAPLSIRFTPLSGGTYDGTARAGLLDPGGPVLIPLVAASPGGGQEDIVDFGSVAMSGLGGVSAELSVDVPADAIGVMIEVRGSTNGFYDLASLTGPGDRVYLDSGGPDELLNIPGREVFTAQIPSTDKAHLQLVPGGGAYRFRVHRISGATSAQVRVLIERRPGAISEAGILPLNIWLAQGIAPTAATASSDTRLLQTIQLIDDTLSQEGVRLGDIAFYDIENDDYDFVSEFEFATMLRTLSATAAEPRLNLFFVVQALGNGVVGVAGMIGGPKGNGTGASGVMSVYDSYSVLTVALVASHEIGHFLGLEHSNEDGGGHDAIDDTPNCPADCTSPGGDNLMHWQAIGADQLTPGQGLVIRGHPLMEPSPAGSAKPHFLFTAPPLGPDARVDDSWKLGTAWCGTCRQCRAAGPKVPGSKR